MRTILKTIFKSVSIAAFLCLKGPKQRTVKDTIFMFTEVKLKSWKYMYLRSQHQKSPEF